MAKYLSQVVQRYVDVVKDSKRRETDAYHALDKPAMLEGNLQIFTPANDQIPELPKEEKRVDITVDEMIAEAVSALVPLFDVTATRDFANGPSSDDGAVADVVIGDQILIAGAPVQYLLWLERELDHLDAYVKRFPTHTSDTDWTLDDERGVYKSTPIGTARAVPRMKSLLVAPETDKHPAQYQVVQEAVQEGIWTKWRFTGAIPVAQKAQIQRRLLALRTAVHEAREQANRVEVEEKQVGARLLSYIFE